MERLTGKVVVVTGAASGIGRASAERVEREGGIAVRADVNTGDGDADVRRLDVTDESAVEALMAEVVAAHGRIDGVVNAAGRDHGVTEIMGL
jgi:3(or 17)beta-hydroxysteroid dehydrogenase